MAFLRLVVVAGSRNDTYRRVMPQSVTTSDRVSFFIVSGVKMTTTIRCYCLAFIASVVLMGCDSGKESKSVATPEKKSYVLTEREKTIIKVVLVDEIDLAAHGNDVAFPDLMKKLIGDYVVATSAKLQKEYERNEVAGDQQFRKKVLLINGTVKSIDRGIGENYFIGLKGGSNPFMEPKASMADGYTDFLAGLQKGNEVWLVCRGNGMLVGSAMLSDCEPLLNYAGKKADSFIANISIGDVIKKPDRSLLSLSVLGITIAASLPDSSSCFTTDAYKKKCINEIWALTNSKDKAKEEAFQTALKAVPEKIGVDKGVLKEILAEPKAAPSK